jgi:hypothetical protein
VKIFENERVINSEINNTMQNEKNESLKVIAGHEFRFRKFLINDVERWCCTVKTCKCFAKLNSLNNIEIEVFNEHNNHKPFKSDIKW